MTWPNAANPNTRPSILPSALRANHDERIAVALETLARCSAENSASTARLVEVIARFVELVERIAEREERP